MAMNVFFLVVIAALQGFSESADYCLSSVVQDCLRKEINGLAKFQERSVQYEKECDEKEHFHIRFLERASGMYQLEIGVNQSFEGLLLQMCDNDGAYFLSTEMNTVSTCNYQNDVFIAATATQVLPTLPIHIGNPKTSTIIRYIVLDHKMCSYQGLLKFDQRELLSQSYDNAEIGELHTSERKRRQVSTSLQYFLVVSRNVIHQVSLDGTRRHALVSNLVNAIALDYDYRRNKMYWTDVSKKIIMQANLDGSGIITLLSQGLGVPDGLATDWITNKLYFTDASLDIIGVFDPVHFFYRVLIQTGSNTQPRAIILDPNTRMMYWTDWGTVARIERASMDGSNRRVIHNTSLVWPNALTIDYQSQTLYWADANLKRIESSGVDGTNRILLASTGVARPFGMAFHQNVLYVSDWENVTVRVLNSTGGRVNILAYLTSCSLLFGIRVIDVEHQPMALNPCESRNGGCSHFCLLSASSAGYSCACPDGQTLEGKYNCIGVQNVNVSIVPEVILPGSCTSAGYTACCSNNSCQGSPPNCYCDANCHRYGDCCSDIHPSCLKEGRSPYMVVSERAHMRHFDFKNPTRSRTFLSNLNDSLFIDYHYRMNAIFWSNNVYPGIWRSSLNGSGILPLTDSTVGQIAIDWISDKLYWSDYNLNLINVIDLHTGYRKILFSRSVYQPVHVLVDPNSRYIFWAETSSLYNSGRVVRASMDGSNGFTVLMTTSGITVLTIDYSEQTLYWYSGNQLGSIGTNGSNYRIINSTMPLSSNHSFFLSHLEDGVLLFTIFGRYTVYLMYMNGTLGQMPQVFTGCYGFSGSKVISQDRQPIQGVNPCGTNNGGCSDLCLLSAVNPNRYSCACHKGTLLSANGRTCEETGHVQSPPRQGSCHAAGNTGCCTSGDCRGFPVTCGCDVSCVRFSDCCSDVISLCPNISIPDPPSPTLVFLTQPSDQSLTQNMSAILKCSLSTTIYATIEWMFTPSNGKQTTVIANQQGSFFSRYDVMTSINGLSLVLRSANFSTDQGVYTCIGSYNGKSISSSANVNILFPPFSISLSQPNMVNENIRLICEVRANPAPELLWLRSSEGKVTTILDTSTKITISFLYNPLEAKYTNTLTVHRAIPSDSGEYICEASNSIAPDRTVVATKTLLITGVDHCFLNGGSPCLNGGVCTDVAGGYYCECSSGFIGTNCGNTVDPDPQNDVQPVIQEPPISTNTRLINSINLTCTAEGSPSPSYQWFKDGKLLSGETRPFFYIQETSPEDRGNYICVASNRVGETQSRPARIDIPGIYQYTVVISISSNSGVQDLLLKIASMSTASFPFSVYAVEHRNKTRNLPHTELLVTLYNKGDATTQMIRESFLAYLQALPSISILNTKRFDGCEAAEFDGYLWPETDVRDYASVECPCSEFVSTLAGKAIRYCAGDYINRADWQNTVDTSMCVIYTSLITSALCDAAMNVASSTAEVAVIVANITANHDNLTPVDIAASTAVVDQIISGAIKDKKVRDSYFEIIDNIQKADPEAVLTSQIFTRSSQRIIDSLAEFSDSLDLNPFNNSTNKHQVVFAVDTYALQLQDIDLDNFHGQTFSVDLGSVEEAMREEGTIKNNSLKTSAMFMSVLDNKTAAVQIPENFISNITECRTGQYRATQRLSYSVFLTDILFQSHSVNASDLGSVIVSTRLTCVGNRSLTIPIIVHFRTNDEIRNNAGEDGSCVRWDSDSDEFGAWSMSGCRNVSKGGSRMECECTQLGHFGILFDLNPHPPPPEVALLLSVITYVGAIISLICLFTLIMLYLCSKKLRSLTHSLILVNMSLALAGLYVFFLAGGYVTSISLLCGFSAAFLHYFMLVFFSWTVVEAVWLYYKLVKVFGSSSFENRYILKAGIPAWIVPLLVVIICAGSAHQYYISDYYCNVTRWPFWFGFLLPFLALYLLDWILFIVTFVSLLKHKRKTAANQTQTVENSFLNNKQLLIIAVSLAVLFGLGWGLGLLATSSPVKGITFTFQILFSIFVGFQGLLLFILHGVRNPDARRVWRQLAVDICGKSCLSSTMSSTKITTGASVPTNYYQPRSTASAVQHGQPQNIELDPFYDEIKVDEQKKNDYGFDINKNASYGKFGNTPKYAEDWNLAIEREASLTDHYEFLEEQVDVFENKYENTLEIYDSCIPTRGMK